MTIHTNDLDEEFLATTFNEPQPDAYHDQYSVFIINFLGETHNIRAYLLLADAFDNPWQDRFETRYDYVPSKKFIAHLVDNSDPRLPFMANPAAASGTYVGLEYGLENPGVLETQISAFDDAIIYDGTGQGGWIFTYAEFAFMMAEAYE